MAKGKKIKVEELENVSVGGAGEFKENGDIVCCYCEKTFNKNDAETSKIGFCGQTTAYKCPFCGAKNWQD